MSEYQNMGVRNKYGGAIWFQYYDGEGNCLFSAEEDQIVMFTDLPGSRQAMMVSLKTGSNVVVPLPSGTSASDVQEAFFGESETWDSSNPSAAEKLGLHGKEAYTYCNSASLVFYDAIGIPPSIVLRAKTEFPEVLDDEVLSSLRNGKKIPAIKRCRMLRYNLGLKEAKDLVEMWRDLVNQHKEGTF